jgi:type II restriction enzyme
MIIQSGNKGEWSELYTLAFLLSKGGGFAADSNQNPIPNAFYKVLEIFLEGQTPNAFRKFKIEEDFVQIHSNSGHITSLSRLEIDQKLNVFFQDLVSGENTKTFMLESGSHLMDFLQRDRIAAPSSQKAHDLELVMEDWQSNQASPRVGFSIKSQIGNPSTLFNASGATNLTYKLVVPENSDLEAVEQLFELKGGKLMEQLNLLGIKLEFQAFDSNQFHKNLLKIDSRMPEYIAQVLQDFYTGQRSNVRDVVEVSFPSQIEASEQPIFKIKQFLGAVAMGMRPSQPWDGDITKFKGLILAKLDGDVLFYYLYNISEFQDFLFKNLKFEVASTSRHGFGRVYRQDGELKLKLNLQIRFVK